MEEDEYIILSRKALEILNIDYSNLETLESLLYKLQTAIILPADTLEGEIMILVRDLASMIENKKDSALIEAFLDKLANKVTENLFD